LLRDPAGNIAAALAGSPNPLSVQLDIGCPDEGFLISQDSTKRYEAETMLVGTIPSTVRDLIEELKTFNPDTEVVVSVTDETGKELFSPVMFLDESHVVGGGNHIRVMSCTIREHN
jgi:hypothetical protein